MYLLKAILRKDVYLKRYSPLKINEGSIFVQQLFTKQSLALQTNLIKF